MVTIEELKDEIIETFSSWLQSHETLEGRYEGVYNSLEKYLKEGFTDKAGINDICFEQSYRLQDVLQSYLDNNDVMGYCDLCEMEITPEETEDYYKCPECGNEEISVYDYEYFNDCYKNTGSALESIMLYNYSEIYTALEEQYEKWKQELGLNSIIEDVKTAIENLENSEGEDLIIAILASVHVNHYGGRILSDFPISDNVNTLATEGLQALFTNDEIREYTERVLQ